MVFVGYKNIDNKKVNVKMDYAFIKNDIIKYIEENGGLGGGGEDNNHSRLETYSISVTEFDEDGNPLRNPISSGGTWDTENETNLINVGKKLALIEINAGGQYVEDYLYIFND